MLLSASLTTRPQRGNCATESVAGKRRLQRAARSARVYAQTDTAFHNSFSPSNGAGDHLDPSHPATVEMLVVDDIHTNPGTSPESANYPSRRVVPAPQRAAALLASKLAVVKQQGGGELEAQRVQNALSLQSSQSKALRAELSMAQTQLREQGVELQQTKAALVLREQEVGELRSSLSEKDAKLASARSDLMEAEELLAEKDEQLMIAYDSLTTACKERAMLRSQLVKTYSELSSTRSELESLANDILDLQTVMETIDGGEVNGGSVPATNGDRGTKEGAANGGSPLVPFWASLNGKQNGAGGTPGKQGREGAEEAATLSALSSLLAFTQQIAQEAAEDEQVYSPWTVSGMVRRGGGRLLPMIGMGSALRSTVRTRPSG